MKSVLKYRRNIVKYWFTGLVWSAPIFFILETIIIETVICNRDNIGSVYVLNIIEVLFFFLASLHKPGFCVDMEEDDDVEKTSLLNKAGTGTPKGAMCKMCGIKRPLRSCHCPEYLLTLAFSFYRCNRCIVRFDHHDIVINNCVGYANQHYYVLYLLFALINAFVALFHYITSTSEHTNIIFRLFSLLSFVVVVLIYSFY